MSQQLENHLTMLNVHQNYTNRLNLDDVANDFIAENEHRKLVNGTEFKITDFTVEIEPVYFTVSGCSICQTIRNDAPSNDALSNCI